MEFQAKLELFGRSASVFCHIACLKAEVALRHVLYFLMSLDKKKKIYNKLPKIILEVYSICRTCAPIRGAFRSGDTE